MSKIGVVAIGRNEGDRLRRCVESLAGQSVVYVDSGSTDGSVALARAQGAEVVELDMSIPFCAARARNAGLARLREREPELESVFFVDGDCEIVAGFLDQAQAVLDAQPKVAVVCGRRRERLPEASIYNQLCDLEWNSPVGEALACGGDSVMRLAAFQQVGGFNDGVPAGEEPELCARLREVGWKVLRIDADMTIHDAAIFRFGQFWLRSIRTGWGSLDIVWRFPHARHLFLRTCLSTWTWTLGWLALVLVAGWFLGIWGAVLTAMLWPYQILRLARRAREQGLGSEIAFSQAWLTMAGKWAQLQGHVRYVLDRLGGRGPQLIEYKGGGDPDWQADLARYPSRPFFKEQSSWAVAVYRFGRRVDRRPPGFLTKMLTRVYWLLYRVVETLTGVSLPKAADIGPGLRIWHFGNIFVHPGVIIGANCTLRQGVTIGNKVPDGPVPVLEDDVELGAYAQVLGGVRVGRGAKIGAMSVVLQDVPAGAIAVGVPAQIKVPKMQEKVNGSDADGRSVEPIDQAQSEMKSEIA